MFTFPVTHLKGTGGGGGGGGGDTFPASVAVNVDLDVTIAASFDDGVDDQKWFNLISSPSDGAAQADYDFYLGATGSASTDDPTFTGTVGNSAAYFAMDGGDFLKLVKASNPATFNDMHKTTGGPDFWVTIVMRVVNDSGAQMPFGTLAGSFTAPHIRMQWVGTSDLARMVQRGSANSILDGPALTNATDYVIIMSHEHSSNTTRMWVNSTTATVDSSHTFSTTTTDAAAVASIGAKSNNADNVVSGSRIYAFSSGDEFLDDTKVGAILDLYEARHNRDYTP